MQGFAKMFGQIINEDFAQNHQACNGKFFLKAFRFSYNSKEFWTRQTLWQTFPNPFCFQMNKKLSKTTFVYVLERTIRAPNGKSKASLT